MKVQSKGIAINNSELTKAQNKKNDSVKLGSDSTRRPVDTSDSARVNVSQNARDIHKIKELAMQAPDVDQEKVNKFKNLIASGQYKVNAQAIADKMVDEEMSIATLEN